MFYAVHLNLNDRYNKSRPGIGNVITYANVTIPKIVCTPSWQRLCFDKIAKTSEEMTLYAFCICQPYKLHFPIAR